MAFLRSSRSQSLPSAVQKLRSHSASSNVGRISRLPEIHRRSISFSSLFRSKIDSDSDKVDVVAEEEKKKKPLDIFYREAVGIVQDPSHGGDAEVSHPARCELTDLEEEVRVLQEKREIAMQEKIERRKMEIQKVSKKDDDSGNQSKVYNLHKLFVKVPSKSSKAPTVKNHMIGKTLSPEMAELVTHLYEEEYFKNANFVNHKKLDITCFEQSYAWEYIKHAVRKFAEDKQEVAKWLSAEDLKKVALFGCPSVVKKDVYSAKLLRRFFKIQEDTVCGKCALRDSCKFENKTMWRGDEAKQLYLHHVTRIITLYASEPVPQELVLTPELKESVNRLLREVINLSKTCSAKRDSDDVGIPTTFN
ncbi:hypothetical protein DM860_000798 [Cuscuta australis]|uniref:Uncharacterized protein n=1 Tax=Cuscuta australis TaxID=267555 RepID=A0A328CXX0_9ASTE|nr:hypothetical protein DM860_000798 [Cuscuta australis]